MTITIHHGDCLAIMAELPDNSIDAIVTDPPYGIGFMGKAWDALPPGEEWARECLRVLKPGGHLLAFGGTRTWHRLAVAVEDAGFEIRDSIAWLYGSGFPKSLDVPKAIDKAAGAERDDLGPSPTHHGGGTNNVYAQDAWTKENFALKARLTAPATDAARQWQGWGTALKPAFEPIVMARKPLAKGNTVAANVLVHGTGAINVDGCRIEYTATEQPSQAEWNSKGSTGNGSNHAGQFTAGLRDAYARGEIPVPAGRWPANVALDETMAAGLDTQSGITTSPTSTGRGAGGQHGITSPRGAQGKVWAPGDAGGASRFFYCAKAPKSERPIVDGVAHPTVKPLALMRWLVRLVTPPGGTVLDPFAGSGTTIEAATLEGVNVVGIEREAEYLPLIQARIDRNQVDDDIDDPRYGINPPPAADGGLFEVPA